MCALAKVGLKTSSKRSEKASGSKLAGKPVVKPAKKREGAPATKADKVGAASLAVSLVGKKAPSFNAEATSSQLVVSSELLGQPWVLYFYPKDHTPGCTVEGQDFTQHYSKFKALGCKIFGVSKDTLKRHESFKEKFGFPFELISDENEALCRKFDVIQMKKLYGREYEGIERSTFLVDSKGVVRNEWRRVKVKEHADQVLAALKTLNK